MAGYRGRSRRPSRRTRTLIRVSGQDGASPRTCPAPSSVAILLSALAIVRPTGVSNAFRRLPGPRSRSAPLSPPRPSLRQYTLRVTEPSTKNKAVLRIHAGLRGGVTSALDSKVGVAPWRQSPSYALCGYDVCVTATSKSQGAQRVRVQRFQARGGRATCDGFPGVTGQTYVGWRRKLRSCDSFAWAAAVAVAAGGRTE